MSDPFATDEEPGRHFTLASEMAVFYCPACGWRFWLFGSDAPTLGDALTRANEHECTEASDE